MGIFSANRKTCPDDIRNAIVLDIINYTEQYSLAYVPRCSMKNGSEVRTDDNVIYNRYDTTIKELSIVI